MDTRTSMHGTALCVTLCCSVCFTELRGGYDFDNKVAKYEVKFFYTSGESLTHPHERTQKLDTSGKYLFYNCVWRFIHHCSYII